MELWQRIAERQKLDSSASIKTSSKASKKRALFSDAHSHPSKSSPILPVELVEPIFELAIRTDPKFAGVLCRVCKWAKALAEPHLYRSVTFNKKNALVPCTPLIALKHCGTHVKALRSDEDEAAVHSIAAALQHCPNLSHIFTQNIYTLITAINDLNNPIQGETTLQLTSFTAAKPQPNVVPNQNTQNFLGRITHLVINSYDAAFTSTLLPHLKNLTHFAFSPGPRLHGDAVDEFLDRLSVWPGDGAKPQLECIVLINDYESRLHPSIMEAWEQKMLQRRKANKRMYVSAGFLNYIIMRWEEEVAGGETFWEWAKEYTAEDEDGSMLGRA